MQTSNKTAMSPDLTRRASLVALAVSPGAVGVGLLGRQALASDHDEFEVFRSITPKGWANIYDNPPDRDAIAEAYENPSYDNMMNLIVKALPDDTDGKSALNGFVDALFKNADNAIGPVREWADSVTSNMEDAIRRVEDAVGVIVSEALDRAQHFLESHNFEKVREWLARHVVLAMKGVIFMSAFLRALDHAPARHPLLLIVGAFLFAADMAVAA